MGKAGPDRPDRIFKGYKLTLIVFLNARFCLQLRLQTSNCFCKGLYLRYLCLIRKELLWLNNYPYLNVMLLSECFTSRFPIMGENDCINRPSCQRNTLCPEMGVRGCFASRCKRCPEGIICTSICDNYDSFQCDLLDKPPYVCSNCKMQKGCKKNKAYYSAHKANAAHHKSIKDAHSGVRHLKSSVKLRKSLSPLLPKGSH